VRGAALALLLPLLGAACAGAEAGPEGEAGAAAAGQAAAPEGLAVATFAGGCFWCMEPPFDALPGVVSTTSGYTGGRQPRPTYEQVSAGGTGHAEAVRVVYDPRKVSYEALLDVFWHNIDPTVRDRQFCDHGDQYRAAIFTHGPEQRRLAERSLAALRRDRPFAGDVVTAIATAGPFWPAEEYHQDYYQKNPLRYRVYRAGCGRDARLRELWGEAAGGH
jgi:peptide-methionine (S)-S-oxide reductase